MLFSILTLIILFYTGWFSDLAKQLNCSARSIYGFLLFMIFLYQFPMISIQYNLLITYPFLAMCICFLFVLGKSDRSKLFPNLIVILLTGTILFTFHELNHIHTDWSNLSFRVGSIFFLLCSAWISFRTLLERLIYFIGSFMVTHGWILVFHQEILNPMVIGNLEFLDACWFAIISLIIVQYSVHSIRSRWLNLFKKID